MSACCAEDEGELFADGARAEEEYHAIEIAGLSVISGLMHLHSHLYSIFASA